MSRFFVVAGAMTYYGSHFVYGLAGEDVISLIPAPDEAVAHRKLVQAMDLARFAHEDRSVAQTVAAVLACDYNEPHCGLNQAEQDQLRQACARHETSQFWCFGEERCEYGVKPLLELALGLGFNRFVYVSSAFACGEASGDIAEQAHTGPAAFEDMAGFQQAEADVAAFCAEHPMDFHILRTPLAVGPSLTQKQEGCASPFMDFFKTLYDNREALIAEGQPLVLPGDPNILLNMMPADHFMADVRYLLDANFPDGPYYHLTANVMVHADFALNYLAKNLGLPGIILKHRDFVEQNSLTAKILKACDFPRRHLAAPRRFSRSLPGQRGMTRSDFFSFVYELRRNLEGETHRDLFTREQFETNGALLNLYHAANEGKPPLVLINAIGMPMDFWCRLAIKLRKHYSLYSWESRGVPSSFTADQDGPLSLDDQVGDCLAVMDRFGLDSAHVVGWCSGAQVGTRFAAAWPDRVKKLVLINGTYNLADPGCTSEFMRVMAMTLGMVGKNRKYASMYYRLNYGAKLTNLPDEEPGQLELEYDPALFHLTSFPFKNPESLYQYARLVNHVLSEHGDDWLPKITKDTLVISGTQDRTAGALASRRVAKIIEAQAPVSFHELPDGDHYTLCYHERVPQLIETFLKAQP